MQKKSAPRQLAEPVSLSDSEHVSVNCGDAVPYFGNCNSSDARFVCQCRPLGLSVDHPLAIVGRLLNKLTGELGWTDRLVTTDSFPEIRF